MGTSASLATEGQLIFFKEVIAFANSDDGTLYIGVDDNGVEVGVEAADKTYTQITNTMRDSILAELGFAGNSWTKVSFWISSNLKTICFPNTFSVEIWNSWSNLCGI